MPALAARPFPAPDAARMDAATVDTATDTATVDAPGAGAPYGVLDVGSNSIRLVVFEGLARAPAPVFNERELCGLGATLADTGALAADAVAPALDALRRFAAAAAALGVGTLDAVATAAVRDARDGPRFRAAVARETGISLRVLSGEEEARYAALGVVSAFPDASGLMADLGGGSLELVRLERGRLAEHATLPLGVLRLGGLTPRRRTELAAARLAALDWLGAVQGTPVYLVGGAWRALARLHMAARQHPIPVVHHYRMTEAEARAAAKTFAAADPQALRPGPEGMWPRRLATVPTGAAVLRALLKAAGPSEVAFSAFGLREGLLFDSLPAAVKALDPLRDACRAIAARDGRSLAYAEALESWLADAPLPAEAPRRDLGAAAAYLSEIAWRQHPDLRAADAFARISRAPFVGIDHAERVFLALAVATRYKSGLPDEAGLAVDRLLPPTAQAEARALGLALRLAERLSCGEPAVLDASHIEANGGRLTLSLAPAHRPLASGKAQSAAEALARALGCTLSIATDG